MEGKNASKLMIGSVALAVFPSLPAITYFTAFIALFSGRHKEPEPVSSFFTPGNRLAFASTRL